ncbi:DUF2782 domain-containing protein [Fulvimonas sp. R45]|uniref:DUF2782 domain-containing protein n=1 Tax=Fulvimonas sp. R45 TaxID=3045937 RepID=UPI00265D6336|nr:DUF2782 domain-containing protein [Fulvimonas sp. R45]MDO1529347.1 DUF2782 domain-containing protein [Fulvimonas sp. R45]
MKSVTCLFALVAVVALPAFAQSTGDRPQFQPAPPPPGMNDPGVKPVAPPAAQSAPTPATTPAEPAPSRYPSRPIPAPRMPGQASAPGATLPPPPDVSVRQEGDNTVEEYRESGRVYMIVVRPRHGIPQTYMVDPQGRMHPENGAPPVKPVMYKILEWGKSKPAEASSSAGG